MKNKGFTLVELLGTIVIIGIVFAIAVPSVTYIIRASKKRAYHAHENSMENAATAYLIENDNKIPADGSCYINVSTLQTENYLKSLEDPQDKSLNCNIDSYVIVTRDTTNTVNIGLDYTAYLKCSRYETPDVTKPLTECGQ